MNYLDQMSILEDALSGNADLNYQRCAMVEALNCLKNEDVPGAIHALGDDIDHAHRDGWTEVRPEVHVCVEVFRQLTARTKREGGAA